LGWIAMALLLGAGAIALFAYGSPESHLSLDDRTRAVALQLRCPVCQGESVADSSSSISQAMRQIIRRDLATGKSPDRIKAYFVSKYGDWILLAPPASGVGSFAWLAPPLLLLAGIGLLITLVLDWRRKGKSPSRAASASYLERVRSELSNDSGPIPGTSIDGTDA
jgi:cytochrome c-type biogenesis protein CcmH